MPPWDTPVQRRPHTQCPHTSSDSARSALFVDWPCRTRYARTNAPAGGEKSSIRGQSNKVIATGHVTAVFHNDKMLMPAANMASAGARAGCGEAAVGAGGGGVRHPLVPGGGAPAEREGGVKRPRTDARGHVPLGGGVGGAGEGAAGSDGSGGAAGGGGPAPGGRSSASAAAGWGGGGGYSAASGAGGGGLAAADPRWGVVGSTAAAVDEAAQDYLGEARGGAGARRDLRGVARVR